MKQGRYLSVLVTVLLLAVLLENAMCQTWGKAATVRRGATRIFTYTISKTEDLVLQFLSPQEQFSFTLNKVEPPDDLPLPVSLQVYDLVINAEDFVLPTYNVVMQYKYDKKDMAKRNLEIENTKFLINRNGGWEFFRDKTIIDTTGMIAAQGASTLFDLGGMSERIAIVTSEIQKATYNTTINIKENEFAIHTISEKNPTSTLKVEFNPTSNDVQVAVNKITTLRPGTVVPRGVNKLLNSRYLGWTITTNVNTEMSSRLIYDLTTSSFNIDNVLAQSRKIVAIQYDEETDSYFALQTTYNGYVFYMTLQLRPEQRTTHVYLVQLLGNANVPMTVGKNYQVQATDAITRAPTLVAFQYKTSITAMPVLLMTFTKVETPFTFQITKFDDENALLTNSSSAEFPDTGRNQTLLVFEVDIPDTLDFAVTLQYDHRGNTYTDIAIDRSSLQLLRSENGKWIVAESQRASGSTVRSTLPINKVIGRKTWFAVLASPGEYARGSAGTVSLSNFLMMVVVGIATLFYYGF